jgi:hypothetical protein
MEEQCFVALSDVFETSGRDSYLPQRTRSGRKGKEKRKREELCAGHDINSTETIVVALDVS